MSYCYDIDLSCEECYRVVRTDCNPFLLPVGLTPSDDLFLLVFDKNEVQFSQAVTVDGNGSVYMLPNNFGNKITKYGGEYLVIISETENAVPLQLSISSLTYNCLLIDFSGAEKFCGCTSDFSGLVNGDFNEGAVGSFTAQSVYGWDFISGQFGTITNNGTTIHRYQLFTFGTPTSDVYRNTAFIPGGASYTLTVNARDDQNQGTGTIDFDIWNGALLGAGGTITVDNSGVFKDYTATIDLTSNSTGGYLQITPTVTGAEDLQIDSFSLV